MIRCNFATSRNISRRSDGGLNGDQLHGPNTTYAHSGTDAGGARKRIHAEIQQL